MTKVSILFLCSANICRSPMAEGILKGKIKKMGLNKYVKVDSAGTRASRLKSRPDGRAQKVAFQHGIDISRLKSRRFKERDLAHDYILVMDRQQLDDLEDKYPGLVGSKAQLFMEYCENRLDRKTMIFDSEVPDPYYGNLSGFEYVYQLLDMACESFIKKISPRLQTELNRAEC